jgi:hypothetical protein
MLKNRRVMRGLVTKTLFVTRRIVVSTTVALVTSLAGPSSFAFV